MFCPESDWLFSYNVVWLQNAHNNTLPYLVMSPIHYHIWSHVSNTLPYMVMSPIHYHIWLSPIHYHIWTHGSNTLSYMVTCLQYITIYGYMSPIHYHIWSHVSNTLPYLVRSSIKLIIIQIPITLIIQTNC